MTVLLILSICALTGICVTAVSYAALVSRALDRAFSTLNSSQARSDRQLSGVLDRLMTIKWEDFLTVQASVEPDEGGFITPQEQAGIDEEAQVVDMRRRFAEASSVLSNEKLEQELELLKEDFPEEFADEDRTGN